MIRIFYSLVLGLLFTASAYAQSVEGDWQGTLRASGAELRLVLHITKGDSGGLKATLDSIDQDAMGLAVPSITLDGSTLKFEMPDIDGSYTGTLNAGSGRISGTWSQGGGSLPLEFARAASRTEPKARVSKPSDIDGDWEGTLDVGVQKLRLVLHIASYEDGMTAKLDSLDQNATGLPVTTITRDGSKLKFEMKQLASAFQGVIDKELKTIIGQWEQPGTSIPLTLGRKK